MLLGHHYYQSSFFTEEGAPKYFHNRTFPIDIHACSQAILHFVAFSSIDPDRFGARLEDVSLDDEKHGGSGRVLLLSASSPVDQPHALHAVGASVDAARSGQTAACEHPTQGWIRPPCAA